MKNMQIFIASDDGCKLISKLGNSFFGIGVLLFPLQLVKQSIGFLPVFLCVFLRI